MQVPRQVLPCTVSGPPGCLLRKADGLSICWTERTSLGGPPWFSILYKLFWQIANEMWLGGEYRIQVIIAGESAEIELTYSTLRASQGLRENGAA